MANPYEDIPEVQWISANRFQYIHNETVRQNVAVCFQYITFLVITKKMYGKSGPINLSINRDIVVHTASMIETILHYAVSEIVQLEPEKKNSLSSKWEQKNQGAIHQFDNGTERIIWIRQIIKPQVFSENPTSEVVHKAAFDIGLIDNDLYAKANAIRLARNNIHFSGNNKLVSYPSDATVTKYFDDAKVIFEKVKLELAKYKINNK